MLIVHGIGEHSGRWERPAGYLADHGYAVTSFDQRGHGASGGDRVDVKSFEEFLEDVELLLVSMGDDVPTIIYGHSMGGLIATAYGMSDRPQPDLYVLSAPALSANIPMVLRMSARVLGKLRPAMRMANSITGDQLSSDPKVGEDYFSDPLVETKPTLRFGNAFMNQMDAIRDRYEHLTRPALVIHGASDDLVPPRASAPLAALDNVTRKLFPGMRHEIHNESDWEVALDYVIGWIDTQLS
jgi:alpha-beta hydrolase superfamily lysophospholipase